MPRPNMISGNYNYLGVGGHYKSGIAGLGNVSQGQLDNIGLSRSEYQWYLANLNDDAAYGPGGYNTPGLVPARVFPGGLGTISDAMACQITGMSPDECNALANAYNPGGNFQQTIQAAAFNSPTMFFDPTRGINLGTGQTAMQWIQENWMLVVGGAGLALILLPHTGRR